MNTFNIMESFQVFILLPFSIYIYAIHRILEFNKYIQCKMQKKCFVLVHFFISHFCVVLQTADKRAAWFMMEIWFSTEICLEYMSAKTSCHLAKKAAMDIHKMRSVVWRRTRRKLYIFPTFWSWVRVNLSRGWSKVRILNNNCCPNSPGKF